jgi:thiol-disulfide isomerase/thioredoxin
MKKTLLVLIILVCALENVRADNWMTSFEEAQKMALATDKLMLVDFWATWCGPCKQMDADSWSQDEVKLLMQNFVPVKIDIDSHQQIAIEYGVKAIPFVFIMDGNGKVLYKEMSYKDKNQVIDLLTKYSLSTNIFKQHLINYHNNPSFATAFQLASRYNDYSIYSNDEIRRDILNLSSQYFDESQKLLKKSDLDNKDTFEEKMDMYEIQEAIILNNINRANRLLDKIDEASLNSINVGFFYFLKYIVSFKINDESQTLIYRDKLSNKYKQKAEEFLKAI